MHRIIIDKIISILVDHEMMDEPSKEYRENIINIIDKYLNEEPKNKNLAQEWSPQDNKMLKPSSADYQNFPTGNGLSD